MENENELIVDKLAGIRDNIFDQSDFISDEGYDMLPSYAASPYEVLCGIEKKLRRQQKEIEHYKKSLEKIVTRSMSMYVSIPNMLQDIINIAWEGLGK